MNVAGLGGGCFEQACRGRREYHEDEVEFVHEGPPKFVRVLLERLVTRTLLEWAQRDEEGMKGWAMPIKEGLYNSMGDT